MMYTILMKDLSTELVEVYAAYDCLDDAQAEMEVAMQEWEERRSFKIVAIDGHWI